MFFQAETPTCQVDPQSAHIWRIVFSEHLKHLEFYQSLLSADEEERAGRFKFLKDQQYFIITHAILRILLARYLSWEPQDLVFSKNTFGKPYLANQTLKFNLSHSADLMLLAITQENEIGIDVEMLREDFISDDLAKLSFSEAEFLEYQSLEKKLKKQVFFNTWTRKEAFIKAVGEGIHFGLDQFSVSLNLQEAAKIISINNQAALNWQLHSFIPLENYQAAMAWQGGEKQLSFFSF